MEESFCFAIPSHLTSPNNIIRNIPYALTISEDLLNQRVHTQSQPISRMGSWVDCLMRLSQTSFQFWVEADVRFVVSLLRAWCSWVRGWGWYSSMRSIGLATSPSRGGASQQHRMWWAITMVFSQCKEYLVSVVSKFLSLSSLFQQLHHLRPSPSPCSTRTRPSSLPPHTACQNLNSPESF